MFEKKYVKYIVGGILAMGILAVPVRAAMIATDKPLSGAAVVVDEYCDQVANGTVSNAAVSVSPEVTEAPVQTPESEATEEKE